MFRLSLLVAASLIALTGIAIVSEPNRAMAQAPAPGSPDAALKNIIETAEATGMHNTFVKAVRACGVDGTLNDRGPFTVFAPTDEGFKEMGEDWVEELLKPENKSKLSNIMKFHVVPKIVTADELKGERQSPQTLNGHSFEVKHRDGKILVGTSRRRSAAIVKPDIKCTNGMIQVIDAVMRPPSM